MASPIDSKKFLSLVAIDMGSGKLKASLAHIDPTTWKIIEIVKIQSLLCPIKTDAKSEIPEDVIKNVIETLAIFKKEFSSENENISGYYACATQAYRAAINSKIVIERISKESKIDIQLVSPEEEAQLGYASLEAEGLIPKDKGNVLIWENGGGSAQLSRKNGSAIESFNIPVGKETVREYIATIQKKNKEASPNPISSEDADKTMEWVKEKFKNHPKWLTASNAVLGMGGMFGIVQRALKKDSFTKQELFTLWQSRIGKTDDDLKKVGEAKSQFAVSDLLFLYAVMDLLKIEEVSFKETKGPGSTSGILADQARWKHL